MDARNTPVIFFGGQSKANLHLGATINTISRLFIHQDLKPTLRVSLWDDKADKGIHNFHPFFEGVRFFKETSKWCHYSLLKNNMWFGFLPLDLRDLMILWFEIVNQLDWNPQESLNEV